MFSKQIETNFFLFSGTSHHPERGFEPSVRQHVSHGRLRPLRQRQVQRQDDGDLLQEGQRSHQRPTAATSTAAGTVDGSEVKLLIFSR